MNGGSSGGTICQRRPYNRVDYGVWFTNIRLTLNYDVYLLSLGIVLLSPGSLDILGSRLDQSNKLKESVRKK